MPVGLEEPDAVSTVLIHHLRGLQRVLHGLAFGKREAVFRFSRRVRHFRGHQKAKKEAEKDAERIKKGAKDAGKDIKDAGKNAGKGIKKAGKDIGDAFKDIFN